jgi:hypothetical protein
MWIYNQYTSQETKYACTIVSLLQILLYNYWIKVEYNFIVKLAIFFDRMGAFNIFWWATFSIIDEAFVRYLNNKLGLNFKIEKTTIPKLQMEDWRTFQLWIKKYSTSKFNKAKEWNMFTKESIDYIMSFNGGVWHAVNYDWTAWWYFIDTNASENTRLPLDILKYGHSEWLFFTNLRTIIPADIYTATVTHFTVRLFIAEQKWTLDEYLKTNKDNKYVTKAFALYKYWRDDLG